MQNNLENKVKKNERQRQDQETDPVGEEDSGRRGELWVGGGNGRYSREEFCASNNEFMLPDNLPNLPGRG